MYKVTVNEKHNYEVDKTGEGLSIDHKGVTVDVRQLSGQSWHIIHNMQSYNAEVVNFNPSEKTAQIKINNNIYNVTAKDQFDLLLDKLGLSNLNAAKVSEIKAPMPGMVLKVFATEGMEIKKGDNLFILEAMKMENIIKSPADVTVKTVRIKPGDKVEKGQILMLF